ncbi:MAG: putative oxygen-independent coproporphyrinogen III oxidase [Paracoccaceae bacterium]|jgi:putative oxygen-independent coproporphyrinogen III oxidase
MENVGNPVPGGFGLYIHWPFCVSKCPYCDFNSHVADTVDDAAWQRNLLAELDHYGTKTKGRRLDSVFFGGGTPSLMPPAIVAALLGRLSDYWSVPSDLEVTLEANPSSIEAQKFADFRAAGVNRVSVGIQSFDDAALKFLGRAHSAAEASAAITIAEQSFDRVSFDLIYALPGQSRDAWTSELADALSRGTGHLSLYQLTIEKGTPFYSDHRRGMFALPDEDLAADLYELTGEMTSKAGFDAYEVSNYARSGQESRHNLVYWRGGDYIGVGPGAHGRLTLAGKRLRTEQVPGPAGWLTAVTQDGHATRVYERVASTEQAEEHLMMGLRLAEGIDRVQFAQSVGRSLDDCIDGAKIAALSEAGLLVADPRGLRATTAGIQRLNAIIAAIIL